MEPLPDTQRPPVYRRVLLKLSGEVLAGPDGPLSMEVTQKIARQVAEVYGSGIQIAIVIGGGNIWRGATGMKSGLDRPTADYMGMLATIIDGLALQGALESIGIPTRVQTAVEVRNVAEPFIRRRAIRHLEKGRIVIFVGGTGNPFFSTDTTAALRASEIEAEVILKGTKVDGIYDSDPKINPDAKRFTQLSYLDAIQKRLSVMDSTAFTLCLDNNIPIVVFNVFTPGNLRAAVFGEPIGTRVCG
ncbi:UMP kinase [Methylacidimicrobium tartarophylax]|uniref:Uridylate kinase n=1 Tax=Methylacidimicrobium tartarophylax TaxID=1041768 RepID=A0A5E6M841_9BACT|nr:UMP kinase [Methylacidimicrobium tartarophylax]VVM04505.1 uridylate kinase [Methylacidimicrobium tartarophylax]